MIYKNEVDNNNNERDGVPETLFTHHFVYEERVDELKAFAARAKKSEPFKQALLSLITRSRHEPNLATAAANAITLLNVARCSFATNELEKYDIKDWQGIRIPGANLSYAVMTDLDLRGADLRNVNFTGAWIPGVKLKGALLKGVQFGQRKPLLTCSSISAFAISPDGQFVLSGGGRGELSEWTISTGEITQHYERESNDYTIFSVSYSPDGQRVLVGGDGCYLYEYSRQDGTKIRSHNLDMVIAYVAYSPDGQFMVASVEDGDLYEFSCETGEQVRTYGSDLEDPEITEPISYSPDGKFIILMHEENKGIYEFSCETGEKVRTYSGANCCSYSPDGQFVLAGCDCDVVEYSRINVDSTKKYKDGHTGEIISLAVSPCGEYMMTHGRDCKLCEWSRSDGSLLGTYSVSRESYPNSLCYMPDSHSFMFSDYKGIYLWSGKPGSKQVVRRFVCEYQLNLQGADFEGSFGLSAENFQLVRYYQNNHGLESFQEKLKDKENFDEYFGVVFELCMSAHDHLPREVWCLILAYVGVKSERLIDTYLSLRSNFYTPLRSFLAPIISAVEKCNDPDADKWDLIRSNDVRAVMGKRLAIPDEKNHQSRLDVDAFIETLRKINPEFVSNNNFDNHWALFKVVIRLVWFDYYTALSDEELDEVIEPTYDSQLTLPHQKCYASLALSFHHKNEREKAEKYRQQAAGYDKEIVSTIEKHGPEWDDPIQMGVMT